VLWSPSEVDSARELELDASEKIHLVEHRISPFINHMLAQDTPGALQEGGAGEVGERERGGGGGVARAAIEAESMDDAEGSVDRGAGEGAADHLHHDAASPVDAEEQNLLDEQIFLLDERLAALHARRERSAAGSAEAGARQAGKQDAVDGESSSSCWGEYQELEAADVQGVIPGKGSVRFAFGKKACVATPSPFAGQDQQAEPPATPTLEEALLLVMEGSKPPPPPKPCLAVTPERLAQQPYAPGLDASLAAAVSRGSASTISPASVSCMFCRVGGGGGGERVSQRSRELRVEE